MSPRVCSEDIAEARNAELFVCNMWVLRNGITFLRICQDLRYPPTCCETTGTSKCHDKCACMDWVWKKVTTAREGRVVVGNRRRMEDGRWRSGNNRGPHPNRGRVWLEQAEHQPPESVPRGYQHLMWKKWLRSDSILSFEAKKKRGPIHSSV